ncbi:MAG: succinylglutamate desuccinylase/aspartoacylase family protein [Rhodoferax sp.]|nr:succinylglutamate desuccinylase/aspartoacylase family protein [Rhodoferax sp.]
MQRVDHPLLSPSLGVQKTLSSFHYGTPGQGRKVYIQASLHAEELPGMLVAHHLRALLEAAQAQGQFRGEVVLVPVANPIGLAQRVDHKAMGRFELDTSENFNRHYPDLARSIEPVVRECLSPDADLMVDKVRAAMGDYVRNWVPNTELQSLRRTLLLLAHDADRVIDLHCDCEAVMHFYTEQACWPALEPLARLMGSRAILLARDSGGGPFDECLSGVWWQLSERLRTAGHDVALPQGCCSTTIELRGEGDVTHACAKADAQALFAYLQWEGVIACDQLPEVPAALCQPTPMAGSETVRSPGAGVVVFAAQVGDTLQAGDLVAEIIDPISNSQTAVRAGVAGVFYARIRERYAITGAELGKIAGAKAFRSGNLLGA